MKKLKFSIMLIVAAISILAIGSAALSAVNFERSVTGQVLVDTDENVAIQITNISKYSGLVKTGSDGRASFHLNDAISNRSSSGFNTNAEYSIGTATEGVIKIKNNSDIPVTVTMNQADGNAISLIPVNGSSATIRVGSSSDFYFTVNTYGQPAFKNLNAVVRIEGN